MFAAAMVDGAVLCFLDLALGIRFAASGTLQRSAVTGNLGQAAPCKSTGEAMALMEELAGKLPSGIGYDWTGMSYQERLSGNRAPALYAISLIVVFLCLAAL